MALAITAAGPHTSAAAYAKLRAPVTPGTGSTAPELRTRATLPAGEDGLGSVARDRSESGRAVIAALLAPLESSTERAGGTHGGVEPRDADELMTG